MKKTKAELTEIKNKMADLKEDLKSLSDDELMEVSGGYPIKYFKSKEEVEYILNIGEFCEVYCLFGTVRCQVVDRSCFLDPDRGWQDNYLVDEVESHWYFNSHRWVSRCTIETPKNVQD